MGDTKQTSLTFNYTYDGNGNITGVTQTERSGNVATIPDPQPTKNLEIMSVNPSETVTSSYTATYTYDEAGQLVEAVDGETNKIYRYKYDNSGNIIRMEEVERDEAGNEVTTSNKTFSYTNGILSSYRDGNTTVTYRTDAMGNPISISTRTGTQFLTWGEGRMLLRVKQNASNYSQYTYNADGLRIKKDVMKDGQLTTSKYIWGNNGLAGIITNNMSGTTTVVPLYDSSGEAIGFSVKKVGGRPASVSTEPAVYTYVKNLQGDVIRILDKTGKIVVSYTYNPWGVPTVTGDTELAALNPCSYRGYDYDEETGYYYLQSRYYDPEVGRFLNTDEVEYLDTSGQLTSCNLFVYCNNSPIGATDPDGHFAIYILGASIVLSPAIIIAACLFALGIFLLTFRKQVEQWIARLLYNTKALASAISAVVSKALKQSRLSRTAVHHIVAKFARDAEVARHYLTNPERGNIGINSPINLIRLNERFHRHLHTKAYHTAVSNLLRAGNNRAGVIAAMCTIRCILSSVNRLFF